MKKLESAGWIARFGDRIAGFFSSEEYQERVESGLISTLDGIVLWMKKEKDLFGRYSEDDKVNKYLDHFVRQYEANRVKLK